MPHIETYYTEKKNKKRFKAVVEVGGPENRKRKTKSFTKKGDASSWLAEVVSNKNQGYHIDKSKITVGEQLDEWLRYKKSTSRKTTYDRYKSKVEAHLKPELGDIPLQELEPFHIENYLTKKRISGRKDGKKGGLKETTLKKHWVILNNMLKKARKLKLIKFNPAEATECPKPQDYEAKYLDLNECSKLLKVTKNGNLMYYFIITLLFTGMRRSEILGLQWHNVNFEKEYIDIKEALLTSDNGYIHEPQVKSDKGKRRILMFKRLKPFLKEHKANQDNLREEFQEEYNNDKNFVFCRPDGYPYHPNTYLKRFKKLIKKANLDNNINIHSLRHTFA
ncbi:MAG: tyrosine-type recombinase/integrase, partial [Candidatus Woesearchaeota archaeon]